MLVGRKGRVVRDACLEHRPLVNASPADIDGTIAVPNSQIGQILSELPK